MDERERRRDRLFFGESVSLSSSLLTFATLTVLYFLAVNAVQDRGRVLRGALSLGVVLALLIGICQMLSWNFLPGSFTNSRAFTTVGALNVLGVLAAVFLPLFTKSIARRNLLTGLLIPVAGLAVALAVLVILNWWVLWAIALVGMLAIIAFDSLNATVLAQDYGENRFALSRFVVPMVVVVLGAFLLLVNFNLGLAVGAILALVLVMFAWVGVNLLGIGMHAYGFTSTGGQVLVAVSAVERAFLAAALVTEAIKRVRATRGHGDAGAG